MGVVGHTMRTGTYIVRAILTLTGALPHARQNDRNSEDAFARDYRRGRLIGTIERAILTTLASIGQFEAIAFVIAAKSWIRSTEFGDPERTEYFLIGTLASTAVALLAGLAIAAIVGTFW